MTTREKELSEDQKRAVDEISDACLAVVDAEHQLGVVIEARKRKIQEHASTLRDIGWGPAARAIGGISESSLRADASRRIDETS